MPNRSIFYQPASADPATDPWTRAAGEPPFDITGLTNGTEYRFDDGQSVFLQTPVAAPTTTYKDEVLADDPVLFLTGSTAGAWQNEGTGGSTITTGSAITFGGAWGGGIEVATLNGTINSVSTATGIPAMNDATDGTYEFWSKSTLTGGAYILNNRGFNSGTFSERDFCGMVKGTDGLIRIRLTNSSALFAFSDVGLYDDGVWCHIVGRKLGSEVSIWVNGSKVFTETWDFDATFAPHPNATASIGVGGRIHPGVQDVFTGDLSAPALYNYGLSDERIAAHFAAGGPA